MNISVYQILFDGDLFFLEAEGFGAAVTRWKVWMRNEYKSDYNTEWEPDEVTRVLNGYIMSKSQIDIWLEEKEKAL